jgi:branched-chain amino acid transport system permease protein
MSSLNLSGWISYAASFGTLVLVQSLACLGLNLQWGQTGLFNVGVAGIVAIGAYTSAILTTAAVAGHVGGYGWPVVLGAVAAMGFAAGVSALIGVLTLRLRTDYLAITTFGVAVVVDLIARNVEPLTGGALGIGFIPRPFESVGLSPDGFVRLTFVWMAVVVFGVYVVLQRLTASPWGRVLRALREDEKAIAALGKSPTRYRLQAFALGGALMGLAGSMQAHTLGFIAPENFTSALTFQIWAMLIIGGSGNHRGALLGSLLVSFLWSATGLLAATVLPADLQARGAALRIVMIGLLLAAAILWRPRGLLGEEVTVSSHLDER